MNRLISALLAIFISVNTISTGVFAGSETDPQNTDSLQLTQETAAAEPNMQMSGQSSVQTSANTVSPPEQIEGVLFDRNALAMAYAYYTALDEENAALYLETLTEENLQLFLAYLNEIALQEEIAAMEAEIAAAEAEAEAELAAAEAEAQAELEQAEAEAEAELAAAEAEAQAELDQAATEAEAEVEPELNEKEDSAAEGSADEESTGGPSGTDAGAESEPAEAAEATEGSEVTEETTGTGEIPVEGSESADSEKQSGDTDTDSEGDTSLSDATEDIKSSEDTTDTAETTETTEESSEDTAEESSDDSSDGSEEDSEEAVTEELTEEKELESGEGSSNEDQTDILTETNFPDTVFLSKLKALFPEETYPSGLTASTAAEITSLDLSNEPGDNGIVDSSLQISNLKGIEYFTGLNDLKVYNNALSGTLDFSSFNDLNSLSCADNSLEGLVLPSSLTFLECYNNNLTTLDLPSSLTDLYCAGNVLTSLDLTPCASTILYLSCGENALTSLVLSGCTSLLELECSENPLSSLDASGLFSLTKLECYGSDTCKISDLNISGCSGLSQLFISQNNLYTLDVSGCPLTDLYCSGNPLSSLDLGNQSELTNLEVADCSLNTLTLTGCSSLVILYCSNNKLTSLDLSDCESLSELLCGDNFLKALDLSSLSNLTVLECQNNYLRTLELPETIVFDTEYDYCCDNNTVCCIATATTETSGTVYTVDMTDLVGEDNIAKVSVTSGGTYESATGIVTLNSTDAGSVTFIYSYKSNTAGDYPLIVTVTATLNGITQLNIGDSVTAYVDGVPVADTVFSSSDSGKVLPASAFKENNVITVCEYTVSDNVYEKYPESLAAYLVEEYVGGNIFTEIFSDTDSLLAYKGCSIRCSDLNGMRVLYTIPQTAFTALTSTEETGGLNGYILEEIGTVATWTDTNSSPVLDCTGCMKGYSYNRSEAYTDNTLTADELTVAGIDSSVSWAYTNALVFSNWDRVKPCLSIRPYMILSSKTDSEKQITVYGGIVDRTISYVALECLPSYSSTPTQYTFLRQIVVYANGDTGSNILSYTITEGTATINGLLEDAETVTIPSVINLDGMEYPVKSVSANAFAGNSTMTSLTIEENLETIDASAFQGCSALTELNVAASVKSFGESSFENCTSLKTVSFSENSQCETIGKYAFKGCTALESMDS